jgi:hypothetical protein
VDRGSRTATRGLPAQGALLWRDGAIVRFTNARPLGEHLLANSYVSLKRLEYPDYAYLTGNQCWVGTTLRYGLDPTSAVWTTVSLGRNVARDAPYSYSAVRGALGYSKELPARLNVQAQVSAYRNVYDEPAPLFNSRPQRSASAA